MQPDFNHLYRELGLRPDCSVDALRTAYRRRLSQQHPDRPVVRADAQGAMSLSTLISLHEQAMQFHRDHGRLPGATGVARATIADRTRDARPPTVPAATDTIQGERANAPIHTVERARAYWLALVVAALVAALVLLQPEDATPGAAAAEAPDAQPLADDAPAPPRLALGMTAATVRAIQGEPMHALEDSWEYGPSWLRFEKGRLRDWYSSPLRPLEVATDVPPETASQAGAAAR